MSLVYVRQTARCGRVSDMRENHSVAVEPEPVSVQVVEWVGLVPFNFQFFTRLAAVFAEEVLLINLRCGLSALRLRIANSVGTIILAISISL